MVRPASKPALAPLEDVGKLEAVLRAIEGLEHEDLERFGAWSDLDELSSATLFDSVEGNPDGVFETPDGKFEATATAYVTLQYGGRRDSVSMSDSYPAVVRGYFDQQGTPHIESMSIDNSSFYGEQGL